MIVSAQIDIRPLGDSALVVVVSDRGASAEALQAVLRIQDRLRCAAIRGVIEITTSFTSVALFFDPARVSASGESIFATLEAQVRSALADDPGGEAAQPGVEHATVEIPVCYAEEFAPDLAIVATHAGIAAAEVVRLHSSAEYRVAAVGFTPGFPYLAGLPPQLATPRRSSPRTAVPAGSVAIGGSQTGIYPMSSPGGWHIIGRTPLQLFNIANDPPALLRPGDRVRFRAITPAQFHAAAAAATRSSAQATANK